MDKKLINNLTEYREWAWETYQESGQNGYIERAFGILPISECWDNVFDENGEWLHDIDEDGNILPEETAQTVKIEEWVTEIEFPAIFVYTFEKTWDRIGDQEIYMLDYVSLSEFGEVMK
jgi:hypothetical protein